MARVSFSAGSLLGRFIKAAMVAIVLPVAIGLLRSLLDQVDAATLSGATFRQWIVLGFLTYVGVHVLLWRPAGLFRASRRLLSAIAIGLFGGQVTSVEEGGKGSSKAAKGKGAEAAAQGSTLVAFSPYVVPVSTVLICFAGWLLSRAIDRAMLDGPLAFLIGLSMAFHWLMAADELQQQRKRWHLETYLLALSLVFVLTVLIAAACLPLAVPGVSFIRTLSDGLGHAQATYGMVVQRLFL